MYILRNKINVKSYEINYTNSHIYSYISTTITTAPAAAASAATSNNNNIMTNFTTNILWLAFNYQIYLDVFYKLPTYKMAVCVCVCDCPYCQLQLGKTVKVLFDRFV